AIELCEERRLRVVVAPAFVDAVERPLEPSARRRLESQLASARAFEERLRQRRRTIRLIAEETVRRQWRFVLNGAGDLVPLTRPAVARPVGVHESTVSRAIADRYVLLPSRQIVPFSRFFEPAQAPCAALARLVAEEETPRSDADLAEELAELG